MDAHQHEPLSNDKQIWFMRYGDECYVVTRFCYFAFLQSTVYRLAHHTLEYYLKAYLVPELGTNKLKRLGHRLVELGDHFERHGGTLGRWRQVLRYMDLFERLRYPRVDTFSHVVWGLPFDEFFEMFETDELRDRCACFNLRDFDEMVSHIRGFIVSPLDWDIWPGPTRLGAEYLHRENVFFVAPPD